MTSLTTYRFTTPDMSCGHCVMSIEESLGDVSGVADVSADLETKTVTVTVNPEQVDEIIIRTELEQAGYPAT